VRCERPVRGDTYSIFRRINGLRAAGKREIRGRSGSYASFVSYYPAPQESPSRPSKESSRTGTIAAVIGTLAAVIGLVIAYQAWQKPKPPVDPPPPPGRTAYVAQADSLCRMAIGRFARYGSMPEQDNAALVKWMDDTGAVFDDLYAGWTSIPVPAGDDKPVSAILDAFKSFNANLHAAQKSAHQAADATDDEQFERIADQGGQQYDHAMQQALAFDNAVHAYGMNECTHLMKF
jgi:hypothetical protein